MAHIFTILQISAIRFIEGGAAILAKQARNQNIAIFGLSLNTPDLSSILRE